MSPDKEEALYMGYGIDLRTASEHTKTRGAEVLYTPSMDVNVKIKLNLMLI